MLNEREFSWIKRLEAAAKGPRQGTLTKWEKEFLAGLLYRFQIQRATLHVTRNMWARITEIGDKIIA